MEKQDLINFEKEVVNQWKKGETYGPVHLSGGNEEPLLEIFKNIKKNGIRTTVYWMPIHKYSAFRICAKVSNVVNTSKIYNEILALPLFPTISKKHQDSVIKVIKSS